MDYSYEDGGDDKANESMPPPAVPAVKTNGEAMNGEAADKETSGTINIADEKKRWEPQTEAVESEKTTGTS